MSQAPRDAMTPWCSADIEASARHVLRKFTRHARCSTSVKNSEPHQHVATAVLELLECYFAFISMLRLLCLNGLLIPDASRWIAMTHRTCQTHWISWYSVHTGRVVLPDAAWRRNTSQRIRCQRTLT